MQEVPNSRPCEAISPGRFLLQVFQASSMHRGDADLGSCKAGLACDQVPVHLGHDVRVIHRHERVGVVEVCGYDSPRLVPVLVLHSSRSTLSHPRLAVNRMCLEAQDSCRCCFPAGEYMA